MTKREYAREYRRKWLLIPGNAEKNRAIAKKYYHANKEKCKERNKVGYQRYHLKKFGIDQIIYDKMFSEQSGLCAICRNPETSKDRRCNEVRKLAVDHDHVTGKIRALLCRACNVTIGLMKEDPVRLEAVAAYVRKHKE
jgi:recombination endonuclease VII